MKVNDIGSRQTAYDAKTSYHRNRFSNVDQRSLFREVEKMTSGKRTNIFPSSLVDPANQFLTYFNDKIRNLHNKFCELPVLEPNIYLPPCTYSSSFSSFFPVTETQPRSQGFSVRTRRDTRKPWSGPVTRLPKKWQYLTATRQGVARYSLMKYTSLRNK